LAVLLNFGAVFELPRGARMVKTLFIIVNLFYHHGSSRLARKSSGDHDKRRFPRGREIVPFEWKLPAHANPCA